MSRSFIEQIEYRQIGHMQPTYSNVIVNISEDLEIQVINFIYVPIGPMIRGNILQTVYNQISIHVTGKVLPSDFDELITEANTL